MSKRKPKPGVRTRRKIAKLLRENNGEVMLSDRRKYTIGSWDKLTEEQREDALEQYTMDARILGNFKNSKGLWAISIEIPTTALNF